MKNYSLGHDTNQRLILQVDWIFTIFFHINKITCPNFLVDCVRKLCTSMRRNAKDERVLFHFNGHGVPKPTDAGEIWVFNKNITQYIPLSLYELQSWMGVPSVYLWDCNSAGTIVNMFMRFAEDHSIRFHIFFAYFIILKKDGWTSIK